MLVARTEESSGYEVRATCLWHAQTKGGTDGRTNGGREKTIATLCLSFANSLWHNLDIELQWVNFAVEELNS